jgi:DNA/RNA endonuclease YhcR with UshA esterase domain
MRTIHLALILGISSTLVGCATSKPAGPIIVNASDKAAIDGTMPTVTVVGVVETVTSTESVVTINFKDTKDSKFYAVVLSGGREAVEAKFGGDIGKAITGKTVHVTGKVVLYRNRPEIVIGKPDELAVVD